LLFARNGERTLEILFCFRNVQLRRFEYKVVAEEAGSDREPDSVQRVH
jgi:hypothetical protein